MKKLLYLIAVSIFVLGAFACGGNSGEKEVYQLEKLRAEARKAEDKIGIKPELATDADLRTIIDEHEEVVQYFREHFAYLEDKEDPSQTEAYASNLAGESLLRAGQLHLQVGDTALAKESFADFELIFHHNPQQQKFAWIQLSLFFDAERKAEKVEQIYNKLIETYYPPVDTLNRPDMDIIGLPHDLAAFFHAVENQEKAKLYSQKAIDYYNELRDKYPETVTWMVATRLLAETYRSIDQPQTAIELLRSVVDTTGTMSRGAMMLAAQTFFEDLNRPDSAVKYYRRVLDYGVDSIYGPTALMQLGNVLLLERDFEDAREVFNQLLDLQYAADQHPVAQRMVAISYEEQKNFDQAQDAYIAITEKYPSHSVAYETFLYLPEFFEKQDKKQLEEQWYNRAEGFFIDMQHDYPEKPVGAAAQEYLARLYIKYDQWDDAVRALKKLPEEYEEYRFAADAYFRIGAIFQNKLEQPDSARVYYEKQIDSYPGIRPSELAKRSIETL